MFEPEAVSSPTRSSSLSPIIRDALGDVDWSKPLDLPAPAKADPRESPWVALSQILPGLFLTSQRTAEDRHRLLVFGCKLVVKMNADADEAPYQVFEYSKATNDLAASPVDEATFFARLNEEASKVEEDRALLAEPIFSRNIAAQDSAVYDIAAHFEEVSSLLEMVLSKRRRLEVECAPLLKAGRDVRLPSVVVHCMAGVSRSTAVVLAYLMKRYHISRNAALAFVQAARPVACPNTGFTAQLTLWESNRGMRVTDDSTALAAAHEVLAHNSVLTVHQLVTDQVRVLTNSSRLVDDRASFGRFVRHMIGEKLSCASLFNILDGVMREAVEDQLYIDSPLFFQNFVQLVASIKQFAFSVFVADEQDAVAPPPTESTGLLWLAEDRWHSLFVEHLRTSTMDACEAAEAISKYVRAVATVQLVAGTTAVSASPQPKDLSFRESATSVDVCMSAPILPALETLLVQPSAVPRVAVAGVCASGREIIVCRRVPPSVPVSLTFSVLSLVVEHAEGFVPWAAMDECVPGTVHSVRDLASIFHKLRALIRKWFLVLRWDGAVGAVGTKHMRRWSSCTADPKAGAFLQFLRDDIELMAFEALERYESAVTGSETECPSLSSSAASTPLKSSCSGSPTATARDDTAKVVSFDNTTANAVRAEVLEEVWQQALDAVAVLPNAGGTLDASWTEFMLEHLSRKFRDGVSAYIRSVEVTIECMQRRVLVGRRRSNSPLNCSVPQLVMSSSDLEDSSHAASPPHLAASHNSSANPSPSTCEWGVPDALQWSERRDQWYLWIHESKDALCAAAAETTKRRLEG